MTDTDQQLIADMQREDDVGLVLRGHLHIEHQLIELLSETLHFPDRCDWSFVNYRAKVELAHAAGLPADIKSLLERIGSIRNDFAHQLDSSISPKLSLDLYNSLSDRIRLGLKTSYKAMGIGEFTGPASLEPRDLLTLIFLNARQATKAAVFTLRDAKS